MFQVNLTVSCSAINVSHISSVLIVLGTCYWDVGWQNWNRAGSAYKKPTAFSVISTLGWNYEIIYNLEVMILAELMLSIEFM